MKATTYGERIVKMETKIDNIEDTLKEHGGQLQQIHEKLDRAITCKVDKSEYSSFRKQVNAFIIALIMILIGVVGYLIDKLYLTK